VPAWRVLIAKVGLDGHDRGAKVVSRVLRDAGFEVIYSGLFQSPEAVAAAAVQEDVDAIGLSILSGSHMTLIPLVLSALAAHGAAIPVIVGGIIPGPDSDTLRAAGVRQVLGPGATAAQVVGAFERACVPPLGPDPLGG
jgi:methylmalonyl-CoA mutase, C-terminal domain